MAVLDFLHQKNPIVVHFNHGTEHAVEAQRWVTTYCHRHELELHIGRKFREKGALESPQEYWRSMRYNFFARVSFGRVITCHHLDDQIENWIFTSLHGKPRLIPHSTPLALRPFLLTPKQELINWCIRKEVPFVVDPSNSDTRYARNRIRHNLMPEVLELNPGIAKTIRKKVQAEFERKKCASKPPPCS